MHAAYGLLAMAAVSHAFLYPHPETLKSPWRRLFSRQVAETPPGALVSDSYAAYGCSSDQTALNVTELAYAEAELLGFCQNSPTITNTDNQQGALYTYGDTAVVLCNMDQNPYTCNSTQVSLILDGIRCSQSWNTPTAPWSGWGEIMFYEPHDPNGGYGQYVQYGSKSAVNGCVPITTYQNWPNGGIPCKQTAYNNKDGCDVNGP